MLHPRLFSAGDRADADLVLAQLPLSLPAGEYHVGIVIDPTNMVDEYDETNNTAVDGSFPLRVEDPMRAWRNKLIWVDRNPLGPWTHDVRQTDVKVTTSHSMIGPSFLPARRSVEVAEQGVDQDAGCNRPVRYTPLAADAVSPIARELAEPTALLSQLDSAGETGHPRTLCSPESLNLARQTPYMGATDMGWGPVREQVDALVTGQRFGPIEELGERGTQRTSRWQSSLQPFFRLGTDVPGVLEALLDEIEGPAKS